MSNITDVIVDVRRGSGSSLEILYGSVIVKPTLAHSRATSIVLPAPSTFDIVDGTVTIPNMQPTPAPDADQMIAWGYTFVFKDRHSKTYEFLVGVPDSVTPVNFASLPRYAETKSPIWGQGPQGDPGEGATVAVGSVAEGTEASVTNSGTNTDAILDFVLPEGPQGPPGNGVNFFYTPASGTAKLYSDGPDTYPSGVTESLIAAPQGGWPLFGSTGGFVKVITHRHSAYPATGYQIISRYQSDAKPLVRQALSATTWGEAKEQANTDVATTVAKGLMSSEDKVKLAGILSGDSNAAPNTTVTRDSAGSTALNALSLSTVPDDAASATNKAYVDRLVLNTPYLYGAIGDGVADDTGAITAWLDSANPNKHLDRGTFKVNGVTTAQSNINVIGVGGKLLGAITNSIMLGFTGNNVNVQGIEVDGGGIARGGIYLSGNSPTIKDCHVHHTYTTNSLAYGVCLQNLTQGYSVIGNRIHNIRSVGNTTQGDSDGASRAIYVTTANSTVTGETVRRGLISQNIIADVDGEEGDAIQVIIMPNYGSAKVDITGNTINGFSRRGIKLQAGDCVVKDNILYSNATANSYLYAITGIDSQYAANNVIQGNTIDLIGFPGAITAVGGTDTASRASRVIIEGNTVRGGGITSRYLLQAVIKGNTVHYSSSYGVYVQASLASVVENNSLYLTGIATDSAAIYVGISSDRTAVKGNLLMEGSPTRIVSVSSPNCVIESNHSLALNNSYYDGNGPSSTGSLYAGNSAQSTALPFTGYAASQRHRGFDNTRAGSYVPNMFYTTTDPTTNGRNHTKGDIYFDFSPQAVSGGYAGWICTVGGNPGTFSRWGLIA